MILKVKSSTNITDLAYVISNAINTDSVELHCIGAGAVNQGVKAIIKAKSLVSQTGKDLTINPGFGNVVIDNNECSMIILRVRVSY